MPTWTPTPAVNIVSQLFIPSMTVVSTIPLNPFNPASFGMSHIPPSAPSIGSGYIPSTSHPIHYMLAQSGYGIFGIPLPHGGGYNPNQSFNPGSFNMLGGNTTWPGLSAQPMSPKLDTGSLPGIPFLETLNIPNLTKPTNESITHLPQWPPIPTKLPSGIPNFEGNSGEDPSNHIMTFHLWCSLNSLRDDSIRLRVF